MLEAPDASTESRVAAGDVVMVTDDQRHVGAVIADYARYTDRALARDRVTSLTEQALSETGRGVDLTEIDLSGLDLSGFDLRGVILNRAGLFGAKLIGADLTGASMVCAGLERTDFTDAVLAGAYVHALAAQASDFSRADMTGLVDATGALFHGCTIDGACLDDAELAGTTFYQCSFVDARATGTDLHGATFNECRMTRADLTWARLSDAVFTRTNLSGVVLDHARGDGLVVQHPTAADGLSLRDGHLSRLRLTGLRVRGLIAAGLDAPGIDVHGCQLAGADFSHADLTGGRFDGCGLDNLMLVGAVITESKWSCVDAANTDATGATGEGLTATDCRFSGAVFSGFSGRYATFRNCDLRATEFRGAYLYRATFVGDPPASACLIGSCFDGANLTQAYLAADFTDASIRGAWATYARVNQSIFAGADLSGTSLFRASAVKTVFTGARMRGHRGAIFADRCPGLVSALRDGGDLNSVETAAWVEDLAVILQRDTGKST